ncbi:hypothetical protein R3P38DRAFT_715177 [Favolaschia claudopus]|uniref:Uncharacterized protein n=1 Tax=Favolaschia claudopus TaxID=2862362 RepID=A0AAV9Z5A1_9AGAR
MGDRPGHEVRARIDGQRRLGRFRRGRISTPLLACSFPPRVHSRYRQHRLVCPHPYIIISSIPRALAGVVIVVIARARATLSSIICTYLPSSPTCAPEHGGSSTWRAGYTQLTPTSETTRFVRTSPFSFPPCDSMPTSSKSKSSFVGRRRPGAEAAGDWIGEGRGFIRVRMRVRMRIRVFRSVDDRDRFDSRGGRGGGSSAWIQSPRPPAPAPAPSPLSRTSTSTSTSTSISSPTSISHVVPRIQPIRISFRSATLPLAITRETLHCPCSALGYGLWCSRGSWSRRRKGRM